MKYGFDEVKTRVTIKENSTFELIYETVGISFLLNS